MNSDHHKPSKKRDGSLSPEEWAVKVEKGLNEEESEQFLDEILGDEEKSKAFHKAEELLSYLKAKSGELPEEYLEVPRKKFLLFRPFIRELAVAALLTVGFLMLWPGSGMLNPGNPVAEGAFETEDAVNTFRLSDGSVVQLNRDSHIEYQFIKNARTINLIEGEVHFSVAKDSKRVFTVYASGVRIEAIGTAFNVSLSDNTVDVIVTEGVVALNSNVTTASDTEPQENPEDQISGIYTMGMGDHANIEFTNSGDFSSLSVRIADELEIEKRLIWRESLITFGGTTLGEIAENFKTKTGYEMLILDTELVSLEIGGKFPSEDPIGFLELLKMEYDIPWKIEGSKIEIGIDP